ncbi:glycosyltransferase [Aliarcobacter butzleri]|uniref:glycosyltransferase n=1 Tax=Aliarcobacter butzleri TaxID=28197 RepID=UPI002B251D1A|nr:glycosyltransferase [Aliarcobacter butzleri]
MFKIIAPNIKNGGGLELLLYLIEHIKVSYPNFKCIIYVDNSLQMLKSNNNIEIIHMNSSLEKIKLFSKKIDNALYFGNLPPLVKSKNSVVYFHNPYLLMPFEKLMKTSIKFFVKYFLQQLYIRFFIKNVNIVACQNDDIKEKFIKKYSFKNIQLLPFFRLCNKKLLDQNEKKFNFCYVSLAHPHKNHHRLIEACEILSNENISFSLALTIEGGHEDLIEKIKDINQKNVVTIVNLGKLPKEEVCKLYAQSKCLVFPSTEESIGLFDESFFMYGEEQDICLRAILKKWDVVKIDSNKFFIFRKVDPISSKQLIWKYGPRNIFYSYRKNLKGYIKYIFILWQIIIYSKSIVSHLLQKRFAISKKITSSMLNGLFGKIS